MVTFFDTKPTHTSRSYRIGKLQRRDAIEIRQEGRNHEVDLHLRDLRNIVIRIFNRSINEIDFIIFIDFDEFIDILIIIMTDILVWYELRRHHENF